MNRIHVAAALMISLATPAFAGHCPADVKRIDEAILTVEGMSAEQLDEIRAMRNEGAELHNSGSHSASLKVLHEALELLGSDGH
ncbi:hypothetical protein O2N63_14155 [Aliiroseovarius sp. KMU-50]|uniref:Uncharacterized protein n=1 Tax=Aliiroseovarius salicola TaxID=3009082 RepID=A0ABT4W3Y0_9RHOB|nr:hypothetical protein [Aliiroseovarius sp. KMU-50]MDA5095227.1 hypothetical protein [Aliiroseovarius sp. KMU-50]